MALPFHIFSENGSCRVRMKVGRAAGRILQWSRIRVIAVDMENADDCIMFWRMSQQDLLMISV